MVLQMLDATPQLEELTLINYFPAFSDQLQLGRINRSVDLRYLTALNIEGVADAVLTVAHFFQSLALSSRCRTSITCFAYTVPHPHGIATIAQPTETLIKRTVSGPPYNVGLEIAGGALRIWVFVGRPSNADLQRPDRKLAIHALDQGNMSSCPCGASHRW